jgi:uncharacterized repeat protein (TIGR03943 family)
MVADFPSRAWLRVAAWLSLCAVALWILVRGQSDLYIAPNVRWTIWLAILAALLLAGLDAYTAWRRGERPRVLLAWLAQMRRSRLVASYALVFLPCVTGVALPPAILGSGSISAAAVTLLAAPTEAASSATTGVPGTVLALSLLQAHDRLQTGSLMTGARVQMSGFVAHLSDLPAGTWLLARFVTPHCVAEAYPIGVLVRPGAGASFKDGAWVTVTGALTRISAQGRTVALLAAPQITHIAMPPDPYLIY